ncbi:MAG: hypothetical protein KDC98_01525 [Planctomycetes bacterium]|nr:hypothetical protein [Planctomycetota bacterium]
MDPTTQTTTTYDVEPGKDTTVQIPNVPGGTIVHIRVGKGVNARIIFVEVVSTTPGH